MNKVTLNGELLHPSDYVSAVELKGRDVTLTITSVFIDLLKMRGGKSEKKPVLTFQGTDKKLVLNKTNASSIATLYGSEAASWVGKRVTFYPTKTQCGRETVDCIRVRETVPPPPKQQPGQQPPAQPDPPASSPESAQEFADSIGGELTGGEA